MVTFNNTPEFDCGGECHNFSATIVTRGFCANCPITSRVLMRNSTRRCVSEDLKRLTSLVQANAAIWQPFTEEIDP
jgi:hypothetical protein